MAVTPNSFITPQGYRNAVVNFVGTTDPAGTAKVVVTGGTNGSWVQALIATNGATAHNVALLITNGGTDYIINEIAVAANVGQNGTALPQDMLSPVVGPNYVLDGNGNRMIYLGGTADALRAKYATAQGTADTLTLLALVGDL